mmetsp:Transcript_18046/g.27778  ORF Transcript_18046/g.27778 Transcript_18046/m.27778 type:complete len:251 (+) Transcript_18046:3255-4007(+)
MLMQFRGKNAGLVNLSRFGRICCTMMPQCSTIRCRCRNNASESRRLNTKNGCSPLPRFTCPARITRRELHCSWECRRSDARGALTARAAAPRAFSGCGGRRSRPRYLSLFPVQGTVPGFPRAAHHPWRPASGHRAGSFRSRPHPTGSPRAGRTSRGYMSSPTRPPRRSRPCPSGAWLPPELRFRRSKAPSCHWPSARGAVATQACHALADHRPARLAGSEPDADARPGPTQHRTCPARRPSGFAGCRCRG